MQRYISGVYISNKEKKDNCNFAGNLSFTFIIYQTDLNYFIEHTFPHLLINLLTQLLIKTD